MRAAEGHPVVVTGASGLIGAATVRAITRRGGSALPLTRGGPGIACDIRDLAGLRERLAAAAPSTVVHTAYLLADRSATSPREALATNLEGFLNVVEAASAAGARSFVYASSIAVYDASERSDQAMTAPRTAYGTMKLLNEQQVSSAGGFDRHCGVRIVNVYGNCRGRGQTGWLSSAVHAALSGRPARVELAEGAAMSVAWADDVGERLAAIALSEEDVEWPAVVDGGGDRVTGAEIATALEHAGAPGVELGSERYDYPSLVPAPWLDARAGRPVLSFADALSRMAAHDLTAPSL